MAIFTAKFNVTGAKRKELVNCISEAMACPAKYQGAPTFSYKVDYITIDRYGTVIFDDRADTKEIEHLFDYLDAHGFGAETPENGERQTTLPFQENATQGETAGLVIEIPRNKVNTENLMKILEGKESLIKKAFGIDLIPVIVNTETVRFPWFRDVSPEEAKAYSHFISALCELSITSKRITMTAKPVTNEKYAFRCFLLRLGFIGSEYKEERKILLHNLSGSSAFKNGGTNNANA